MQSLIQPVAPEQVVPSLVILGMFFMVLLVAGIFCDVVIFFRVRQSSTTTADLASRLLTRGWTLNDVWILMLAVAALCLFLFGYSFVLRWTGLKISSDYAKGVSAVVETLLFQITVLTTIVSLMRLRGSSWRDAFGMEFENLGRNMRMGVFFYAAMMPVFILLSLAYVLLLKHFGIEVERQEILVILLSPKLPTWLQACLIMLAVFAAPVVEELAFRGIIFPALARRMPAIAAICLVSLAFAAFHFAPLLIGPLFIIGAAFSLAYLYSGSIIVPMVMHLLFNGVTIVALFLIKDVPIEAIGAFLARLCPAW
jgi:membrane protease YdiL (CAAX protease family)